MPEDSVPKPDLIATPDAVEALVLPDTLTSESGSSEQQALSEASSQEIGEAQAEAIPDLPGPVEEPQAQEAPIEEPALAEPEPIEERVEEEESEEEEIAEEPALATEEPVSNKNWYVVKVQSGREDTIKEAIERRVKKEGLEEFYGQIVIPVEKYTEVKPDKNGRKVTRTKERKLYPGYLMVEVEYNDRILYLFRETSGVVDFVGSHPGKLDKPPTPMSETEVLRMIGPKAGPGEQAPPVPPPPKGLNVGDRVRVVDGIFNGQEGIVKQILDTKGQVEVEVTIFGRPVPVEVEYYQVEEI